MNRKSSKLQEDYNQKTERAKDKEREDKGGKAKEILRMWALSPNFFFKGKEKRSAGKKKKLRFWKSVFFSTDVCLKSIWLNVTAYYSWK